MTMVEQLLKLADAQLGVREYPPGSNNVRYNTEYYRQEIRGSDFSWCAVFIWWLFRECGLSELYFDGCKTAYVPALLDWAGRRGLIVTEPQPGDLVCFDFNDNGTADHIGICESWDGTYVTTIDGNTGTGNEANGGAVMRRRRYKKYILAVIRPRYEEVEEMNQDQIRAIVREEMDKYLAELGSREPAQPWQHEWIAKARELGISDGSRPMALCTRVEVMTMAAQAATTRNSA